MAKQAPSLNGGKLISLTRGNGPIRQGPTVKIVDGILQSVQGRNLESGPNLRTCESPCTQDTEIEKENRPASEE